MVVVDVEPSGNLNMALQQVFKDLSEARPIRRIFTTLRREEGEECFITGWSADEDAPCAVFIQKVEDSSCGVSFLVYSEGNGGVRLRSVTCDEPWSPDSPNQWGEPYLFIADAADMRE
ncbi:MAG: hypothetical protein A3F84_09765 [Candidatus Handelsmanbacteria bacterium RIFCSPLOWO2_12_FULL_64_10]|uniref:Uncharacterized protein n=1 Tax=Handelsmanbacteria sp. (strain RIFCSPLOWO2_12_FULL_64_10) TaxID=1817868 RepID=A0A1F6CND9_HANXR|nr:MAG: hypothetical protein A3F84_09765 [Candidatus Handelsmanbacteria bacterium RIFCSPLOWO2_12_FULL_64_10]